MAFNVDDNLRAPALNAAVGVLQAKDIDQTVNNSTVMRLDETLVWDLLAGAVYSLAATVMYLTTDAPDIKLGWFTPADSFMLWNGSGISGASVHTNFANAAPLGASVFGGSDGTTARVARVTGTVVMGDTDGEMGLAWAQNVATAADTTVLAGSFGVLRRIA
jgi:hypothetical protein